jgi:hypothetical protein
LFLKFWDFSKKKWTFFLKCTREIRGYKIGRWHVVVVVPFCFLSIFFFLTNPIPEQKVLSLLQAKLTFRSRFAWNNVFSFEVWRVVFNYFNFLGCWPSWHTFYSLRNFSLFIYNVLELWKMAVQVLFSNIYIFYHFFSFFFRYFYKYTYYPTLVIILFWR